MFKKKSIKIFFILLITSALLLTVSKSKEKSIFHFAFLGIPAHGHINPTLPLVKNLIKSGHKVIYFNTRDFKNIIEASGATFIDYESPSLLNLSSAASLGLEEAHRILFDSVTEILPKLQKIDSHFDAVIYDQAAFWGHFFSHLTNKLSFCSNTTLVYSTADITEELFPQFISNITPTYTSKLNLLKQYDRNLNSYEDILDIQTCSKSDRVIVYFSPEFQPNITPSTLNRLIYLGNRFDSQYSPSTAKLTKKSLVYVSLGTVVNDKPDLLIKLAQQLSETDYQIVISTGGNLSNYIKLQELRIPNLQVYEFVNQLDILSKASLFITHGGFNSIYEGLYFSVPMIIIPITNEQKRNALLIQELNAGFLLETPITHVSITEALQRAQKNWSDYKKSSIKIRANFLRWNTKLATEKIEEVLLIPS